jgi:integrase
MARRDPTAVWIRKRKGKRGITYGLRWIDPKTGQGYSEACGTSHAYARDRRQQIKEALRDGLSGRCSDVSIEELIEKLPTLMAGNAATTISRTIESIQKLEKFCKVRMASSITKAVMLDFRAERLDAGKSIATINKDARQIRSALSYCVDAEFLDSNPLLGWKKLELKQPEKIVRVIEPDEFQKLIDTCDDKSFRTLLIVGYREGLRRNELINLRWAAVDFEASLLRVVNIASEGELTKSRKNRVIPLHPKAKQALADLYAETPKRIESGRVVTTIPHAFTWPNGQTYKPDWVTRSFKALVKKAGIVYCTPHDLRRSFSTIAQRAGVDRSIVKDLGGWSEISVLEKHYTGEMQEAHQRAMDMIVQSA